MDKHFNAVWLLIHAGINVNPYTWNGRLKDIGTGVLVEYIVTSAILNASTIYMYMWQG